MMQRLDILPGPNQPSGCVAEAITQSKPVSTPKKRANTAIRRKIAESGEAVSVAELDTAARRPTSVVHDGAHFVAGSHTRPVSIVKRLEESGRNP